ncbi:hypothetical protein SUGI_0500090 [Cryptomeria japonica]|uniref:AAA-ATPase At3g28610 n=1 Tax=Cryptomeria japonica TaxID=3369 RepID=UPI002408B61A|nr:AAA-ATPase At3g28610 [Cryptomeria japonica]GLJ26067.1 hypothetical protein SUGI_0500090 [Cryptomeria japonica]
MTRKRWTFSKDSHYSGSTQRRVLNERKSGRASISNCQRQTKHLSLLTSITLQDGKRISVERIKKSSSTTMQVMLSTGMDGLAFRSSIFPHSSTLDTIALDPRLKSKILMDLDRFKRGKEFYSRIGRFWKRGYLLHGSPGTGKPSPIAAIANYMKYNVYDLDLTRVKDNMELCALLTQTKEKFVIVIEDIDCSLHLTDRISRPSHADEDEEKRSSKVILSGLLNFTDELWSCCGEERIIMFTTNHKDILDSALLRCERMGMHILLSFCTFPAFKSLAFNYLEIEDHRLFSVVEEKMGCGAEMTPAEIIEVLMNKMDDPDEALRDVIFALGGKKKLRNAPLTS